MVLSDTVPVADAHVGDIVLSAKAVHNFFTALIDLRRGLIQKHPDRPVTYGSNDSKSLGFSRGQNVIPALHRHKSTGVCVSKEIDDD